MTEEPDFPEDLDELDDDEPSESPTVKIEISGLSLYTRHGLSDAERELGQRLVFDIGFELDECDATTTDRVEDTVDYADVCEQVARRPGALLQDPGAAVHGGRGAAERSL